jgi:PhnB protein
MTIKLSPYLGFRDDAREAMEFYRSVFGGQLDITPFGAFGTPQDPADADKVMHSQLVTTGGLQIMAADTPAGMEHREGSAVTLGLFGGPDDDATLRGYWDALSAGGTVVVPLAAQAWGDTYGQCTDRFGTQWMVNIEAAKG